MKKTLIILSSILVTVILIMVGALGYRLSKGPIDLTFASNEIHAQFKKKFPDLTLDYSNPQLDWSHRSKSIVIKLTDLVIKNKDDTTVTDFPKVSFGISIPYLIGGQIIPTSLEIEHPKIQLYTSIDNKLSFNISYDEQTIDPKKNSKKERKKIEKRVDLILDHLTSIYIKSGHIDIKDEAKNTTWHLRDLNLELFRSRGELTGHYNGGLKLEQKTMQISGDFSHHIWERITKINANFIDLDTKDILKTFPKLKFLSYIQAAFDGSLALTLEAGFNITTADLNFTSKAGILDIPEAFPNKLPFDKISFKGTYDGIKNITTIQDLEFKKDTHSLNFGGTATQHFGHINLQLDAFLKQFPIDLLDQYWPPEANPPGRNWVINNLSKGVVNSAWIILDFDLNLKDYTLKTLNKLYGEIDGTGVTVSYYHDLPKVTNVDMSASFDQNGFDITPTKGNIGALKITNAHIVIKGFLDEVQKIYLDIETSGPLKTAIGILDAKPLYLIKGYGLNKAAFSGKVVNKLHMNFPLTYDLERKDMTITSDATVTNMGYKNLLPNLSLIDADFDLNFSDETIHIKGKTSLPNNHRQLDFTLDEVFSEHANEVNRVITAHGPIRVEAIKPIMPTIDHFMSGMMDTRLTLINKGQKDTLLKVALNLKSAEIKLPETTFVKKHGVNATLTFNGELTPDNTLKSFTDIQFIKDRKILDANYFSSHPGRWEFEINDLNWGGENLTGFIKSSQSQGYEIDLQGTSLDLGAILKSDEILEGKPEKNTTVNIPNFLAKIKVDRLIFKENKALKNVNALIHYRDHAFKRIKATGASSATQTPFSLIYSPINDTTQHFSFETQNFGDFIDQIGAMPGYSGGDLQLTGNRAMTDSTLKLIAKMGPYQSLNSSDISDVIESDNPDLKKSKSSKDTITFNGLDADMMLDESTFILTLNKLNTKGPSIGITAKGTVDFYHQTLNLKGLFAPAQTINRIINFIPIIGTLITGFSGNLIVIEYKMKGDFKDPKISINPLATLVPGILRDFFS